MHDCLFNDAFFFEFRHRTYAEFRDVFDPDYTTDITEEDKEENSNKEDEEEDDEEQNPYKAEKKHSEEFLDRWSIYHMVATLSAGDLIQMQSYWKLPIKSIFHHLRYRLQGGVK